MLAYIFCSSFAVFGKNLTINGFTHTETSDTSKDFFFKYDLLFPEISWDIFYSEGDRTIEMVLMSNLIIHYNLAYSDQDFD